jgi:N-acetylglucosamine-6-sulfatase
MTARLRSTGRSAGWKLLLVVVALPLILPAGAATAPPARQDRRPNIVVIETDDQTVGTLGVMPNVRRLLVAQGTTFANSFVANPLCCPSRATLLTGQYSHNNGVWDNRPPQGGYEALRPTHRNTLPTWLQRAGYVTVELGRYLKGYGLDNPHEIPSGWSDWHGAVDRSTKYYGYTLNENGTLHTYAHEYQTDLYAQKAAELIAEHSRSPKPFFMWIAFSAPHTGLPREPGDPPMDTPVPAPRDKGRFKSAPLPYDPSFNEADVSDKPNGIRNLPRLGPAERAAILSNYRQQLETLLAVDDAVGRIVGALAESGDLERTLIVFTSDNGFFYGQHRVPEGKILPYEPAIRVPLIMRGPGVPAGRIERRLVANIDLAPTFVAAAQAHAGRRLDGRSLLSLLADPQPGRARELLIERGPHADRPKHRFFAVRTPRFLYVEYVNGQKELYDLARDPYELNSLYADPAYAQWRRVLARRLARLRSCAGAACR